MDADRIDRRRRWGGELRVHPHGRCRRRQRGLLRRRRSRAHRRHSGVTVRRSDRLRCARVGHVPQGRLHRGSDRRVLRLHRRRLARYLGGSWERRVVRDSGDCARHRRCCWLGRDGDPFRRDDRCVRRDRADDAGIRRQRRDRIRGRGGAARSQARFPGGGDGRDDRDVGHHHERRRHHEAWMGTEVTERLNEVPQRCWRVQRPRRHRHDDDGSDGRDMGREGRPSSSDRA